LLKSLPELPAERLDYGSNIYKLGEWIQKSRDLKTLSAARVITIDKVREREAALSELTTELEQVEAELEQLMSELNVCPLCDRPMREYGPADLEPVSSLARE
jgi:DNA repair exonuclease SbcCD ATPase subunit